jgi:DNA-binding transcriptional LysR family regulator
MIHLHRLEGFYWVAVAGGYTDAARRFPYPITQPGVYQQVHRLEEELGVALFERVGRDRMALTRSGRALFDFCRPFFDGLPSLARAIAEGRSGGVLRVDAAPLEMQLLPAWARRLRKARPDLTLRITESERPDPMRLLTGETDLVVDHIPNPPAFLVVPVERGRARRATLAAETLSARPLVGYLPGSIEYAMQHAGLERLGITSEQTISASSTDAILRFVAEGLGFSLVPWPTRRGPTMHGICARRLDGPGTEFTISMAYRERTPADPWIDAALEALRP